MATYLPSMSYSLLVYFNIFKYFYCFIMIQITFLGHFISAILLPLLKSNGNSVTRVFLFLKIHTGTCALFVKCSKNENLL